MPHTIGNLRNRQALEIELQTARQHGDGQLLRISRREQELDVRRRLLEGFQKRIERVSGQHVHFVHEIDLVAPASRRVLHVVQQLSRVVDLGTRGGIDLDEVHEASAVDLPARRAHAAGLGGHAGLAVQALGKYPGDRRLAYAPRASEQERVVYPSALQGVDESAADMFLPDQLGEFLRPPFAR